MDVWTFLAKKSGLLAIFKNKSGHGFSPILKAFRHFCPLSHFFLLINVKEKLIIYII